MKQYKSIDIVKFLCALLIIIIHTAPLSSYSKVLTFGLRNIVCVIAVPFFFVASGFITFKKLESLSKEEGKKYIFNNLKRIIIMYLIWSAVYFIFVIIKWSREDFSVFHILEYIKDFFFEGSYSTIWFLPALFGATLLVYLLHKKLSYKTIFIIACFVYLFTLGGSSYYGLVSQIPFIKGIYNIYYSFFDTIKNGVCFGLIFVSIGAVYAQKIERKTSFIHSILPVIVLGMLFAIEEFVVAYFNWNSKGVDTVLFLVPFTYFFFNFVQNIEFNVSESICGTLRKYSILMFLTQRIPLSVIDLFMSNSIIATNSILYFLIVLITTFIISFVIIQFSKKIKVLKYAF